MQTDHKYADLKDRHALSRLFTSVDPFMHASCCAGNVVDYVPGGMPGIYFGWTAHQHF